MMSTRKLWRPSSRESGGLSTPVGINLIPGARQNGGAIDLRSAGAEHGAPAVIAQAGGAKAFRHGMRGASLAAPAINNLACIRVTKGCANRRACASSGRASNACGESFERGIEVPLLAARA